MNNLLFYVIMKLVIEMNKKYLETAQAYINGIISLAKEQSDNLKKSDITIELYAKEDYEAKILKIHRMEEIPLRELNQSLVDSLNDWLIDGKAVACTARLLEKELGKTKKIYTIQNRSLDEIFKKNKPYFYVEDILIIEFDDYYLWVILGNN